MADSIQTSAHCLRSLEEADQLVREVADEPLRALFLARAMRAVAQVARRLDRRALGEAASASSDLNVLVAALERPAMIGPLSKGDPLASARLRGLAARRELLQADGGTVSAAEAGRLLGLSRQAVDKRRRAGRLLALSTGRRGYEYPAWQFGRDGALAGLEETLQRLASHDPWTKLSFFLHPNVYLDGMTPLERLRHGDRASVLRAADSLGEQGAA